jgi:hypothetical protein
MKNLFVIHHEMGHVQYFLQYKDQPELNLGSVLIMVCLVVNVE